MKKIAVIVAAGALALGAAGCTKRPAEAASAPPPESEAQAAAASAPQEAELAAPAPRAPPCVKALPEDAVCSMDLNICGHASMCDCGPGYVYDRAMGMCVLDLEGVASPARAAVIDDDCVRPASGACTRDVNACGQPSQCQCDEGYAWNAVAGKCVRDLG